MKAKMHLFGWLLIPGLLSSVVMGQEQATQDPQTTQEKNSRVPEVNREVSGVDSTVHSEVQDPQNKQIDPLQQRKKKQSKPYSLWGSQRPDDQSSATRFGFAQPKSSNNDQSHAEDANSSDLSKTVPSQSQLSEGRSAIGASPGDPKDDLTKGNKAPATKGNYTRNGDLSDWSTNSRSKFDPTHSQITGPRNSGGVPATQLGYKLMMPPTPPSSQPQEECKPEFKEPTFGREHAPTFVSPFPKNTTLATAEKLKTKQKKKHRSPSNIVSKKESSKQSQSRTIHIPNAFSPASNDR